MHEFDSSDNFVKKLEVLSYDRTLPKILYNELFQTDRSKKPIVTVRCVIPNSRLARCRTNFEYDTARECLYTADETPPLYQDTDDFRDCMDGLESWMVSDVEDEFIRLTYKDPPEIQKVQEDAAMANLLSRLLCKRVQQLWDDSSMTRISTSLNAEVPEFLPKSSTFEGESSSVSLLERSNPVRAFEFPDVAQLTSHLTDISFRLADGLNPPPSASMQHFPPVAPAPPPATTTRRLYRDVLASPANHSSVPVGAPSDNCLEKTYDELERLAMEQYHPGSEDSIAQQYQELEKQAEEQYEQPETESSSPPPPLPPGDGCWPAPAATSERGAGIGTLRSEQRDLRPLGSQWNGMSQLSPVSLLGAGDQAKSYSSAQEFPDVRRSLRKRRCTSVQYVMFLLQTWKSKMLKSQMALIEDLDHLTTVDIVSHLWKTLPTFDAADNESRRVISTLTASGLSTCVTLSLSSDTSFIQKALAYDRRQVIPPAYPFGDVNGSKYSTHVLGEATRHAKKRKCKWDSTHEGTCCEKCWLVFPGQLRKSKSSSYIHTSPRVYYRKTQPCCVQ